MILVTGATGLVGSYLLLSLIQEKKPVVALYRTDLKKNATLEFLKKRCSSNLWENIIWRKADLCNLPSLEKSFENITHLYHCAAFISFAHYKRKELMEVNHIGTTYIVDLAIKHHIKKIVYVSSTAALGDKTNSNNIDESTPWDSNSNYNPYAHSKLNAELEVWRASQEGIPVIIINPGIILGLGISKSPLELFCKRIDSGMTFYPKGSSGFVTVEDVISSMVYLMNSNIKNERFILVAENWSYKKFMSRLASLRGKKAPKLELKRYWLKLFWGIEWFLSLFGKRRFMSKAFIDSLCNSKKILGHKITKKISFTYTSIEEYLLLLYPKK